MIELLETNCDLLERVWTMVGMLAVYWRRIREVMERGRRRRDIISPKLTAIV